MRLIIVATCVTLFLAGAAGLADDLKPSDPIAAKLGAAKKKYKTAVEKAKAPVLKRMDKEEKAARKKRPALADRIKQERDAFASKGMFPSLFNVGDYERGLNRARSDFGKALTDASNAYARKKQVEDVKSVYAELAALNEEIGLEAFHTPPAFPAKPTSGDWKLMGDELVQDSMDPAQFTLGDPGTEHYNFSFEAKAVKGAGTIFARFYQVGRDDWFEYIAGSQGNTVHEIRYCSETEMASPPDSKVAGKTVIGEWRTYRIEVRLREYWVFVDNVEVFHKTNPDNLPTLGGLALGTVNTAASFRNIVVTLLNGKIIWAGSPETIMR